MDIKEELEDRYSNIPKPVYNLMDIAYIKSRAKMLSIEEIKETPKEIVFKFAKDDEEYKNVFKELLKNYKDKVLLRFGEEPSFVFVENDLNKEEMLLTFKEMLSSLTKITKNKQ